MKAPLSVRALLLKLWNDNAAVQVEASFESMRRILVTFWLFLPTLVGLVLWYGTQSQGQGPAADRAQALALVNGITAVVTLVLALVVIVVLGRHAKGGWATVVLQTLMCALYLTYGLALALFDVGVGGVSAFVLVCFAVAGLSLMRPLVSALLFGTAAVAVCIVLELSTIKGPQLAIMRLNALVSLGLALAVASIIFGQYRKSLLTRRALEAMADHDPLTGLANRRKLTSRLELALAKTARHASQGALLFVDLDHFKLVNDTCGHHSGDVLLQEVAHRLVGCVREVDLVARMGGDEFVVLLEDLGANDADAERRSTAVAQTILDRLAQPYFFDSSDLSTTASIGVTTFCGRDLSFEELLSRADLAMYQAKESGRNTVRFQNKGP